MACFEIVVDVDAVYPSTGTRRHHQHDFTTPPCQGVTIPLSTPHPPKYVHHMDIPRTNESSQALDQLNSLIAEASETPTDLGSSHDLLKLVGVVLAQHALLEIVVDPKIDEKARVSAARTLLATKESPVTIAERLRRSPFAGLTAAQLTTMIQRVKHGESSLKELITELKGGTADTASAT